MRENEIKRIFMEKRRIFWFFLALDILAVRKREDQGVKGFKLLARGGESQKK